MGRLRKLFRDGVPIGKALKRGTDLDEVAEEQVKALVDVAMERVAENLVTIGQAILDKKEEVK